MRLDRRWFILSFLCFFLIASSCIFYLKPEPAEAADWPDLSKIDGQVDGLPLLLTAGPNLTGGNGDDKFFNSYMAYTGGTVDAYHGMELLISYMPDTSAIYEGGMEGRIARESKYGPGYTGERGLQWLAEQRAKVNYEEIEVANTAADYFSLIYHYTSDYNIPWNGLRVFAIDEHYYVSITGEGKGWASNQQFLQAFDILEKYVRDQVGLLSGGLTLEHFSPLENMWGGSGFDHRPAGDLVAVMTDKNGKAVKGEYILFYVEPGSTLEQVMWLGSDVPPFNVEEVLGKQVLVLGSALTDAKGVAKFNYLWPTCLLRSDAFAQVLLQQQYMHDKDGVISGQITAAAIDMKELSVIHSASARVEFNAIAKIVDISGSGRTQEFKDAYMAQYPDAPEWGAGKVRVKRSVALPGFGYTPVNEEFLLMPADIIDIDGDAEAEIVWVTGDRAIARVPDKIQFGDTEVRPSHARLVLSTSSYDSGFETTWDKIDHAIFGFSVGQGLDVLSGIHPAATVTKKSVEFGVSVYDAVKEADFTGQNLMVKVRIRSIVRIDTTGEVARISTIEGSPSVKNAAGQELTLTDDQSLSVDPTGAIGSVEGFTVSGDAAEWAERITSWRESAVALGSGDSGSSGSGSTGIIIGVVVAAAALTGLYLFTKKRTKAG